MVPKDTKILTRNRISKKNIYYNGQKFIGQTMM